MERWRSGVQTKVQNKKRTAHNGKLPQTTAEYQQNHQNTAGTQANYASTRMQMKVQKQESTARNRKNIRELPPDMKKVIKILSAHKLITKAQRMQMKVRKQQKYSAQQQK